MGSSDGRVPACPGSTPRPRETAPSSPPSGSGGPRGDQSLVINNLSLPFPRPGSAHAGAGPLRTEATPPLTAGVPPTLNGCLIRNLSPPRSPRGERACYGARGSSAEARVHFPPPDPYHLQQPRRAPRHRRAGSQPQPTCARADAAPAPTQRSFRGPSPPLPGAGLRVRRPAGSPLAHVRSRAHPTPRLHACSITVPEAGLQASPVPELFEYANEGLSTSQ